MREVKSYNIPLAHCSILAHRLLHDLEFMKDFHAKSEDDIELINLWINKSKRICKDINKFIGGK